jgi:hypothetical protein
MTATNKNIPGKRIKTWHRNVGQSMSLKAFARLRAASDDKRDRDCANAWLAGKASK